MRSQPQWTNLLQKEQTEFERDIESTVHSKNTALAIPNPKNEGEISITANSILKRRQKRNISYTKRIAETGYILEGNSMYLNLY